VIAYPYPLHQRSEGDVDASEAEPFAHSGDHRQLASHMEKRSLMMEGATIRVEGDRSSRAITSPAGIAATMEKWGSTAG